MKKIRYYALLLSFISFISFQSQAAFYYWPDTSAPCNTTLNACLDAASNGDFIYIQTNNTINESISTTKDVSFAAANGFLPFFGTGHFIHINIDSPRSNRNIRIRGLEFANGYIRISGNGGDYIATIENNTIFSSIVGVPAIEVSSYGSNPIEATIKYNKIEVNGPTINTFPYGAILINKYGNSGVADISGQIYNNTIFLDDAEFGKGISIYAQNNSNVNFNITANEVYKARAGGVFVTRYASSTGTTDVDIVSNAFNDRSALGSSLFRRGVVRYSSGIHVINDSGTTNANIINNTMVNNEYGVRLLNGAVGTFNANVYNNLVYKCQAGFSYDANVNATNDFNLQWGNVFNSNFTPGPNRVLQDPHLVGLYNNRLRDDSPAIDRGDSLALLFADAVFVDADGTNRIKKLPSGTSEAIDIGAYEAGTTHISFKSKTSGSYIASPIHHVEFDGNSELDSVHITSNSVNGNINTANEAVYYDGFNWRIFNEDQTTAINDNDVFNVTKYNVTSQTFRHVSSDSAENNTMINKSGLNGHPEYILQVSQNWDGVYNPHPPGIFYFGSNWFIINNDLAPMPSGSRYNIYYQAKSKSAFTHFAVAENTINHRTFISNIMLNGHDCAQIQVTQSGTAGVFNSSPIGVFYDASRAKWAIFNQNFTNIPDSAGFNVIFDPAQIAYCSDIIFKHGFE